MAEVLYRKWRPRALDEVVGQETVTNTLKNAVSSGRLTHAYLFCGPRGTGKTSTARIMAKAVNCLRPQNGEPDNACDNCLAVIEGRALDLIEIDAASNRGIDDIRDLSDKIGFAPTQSQYKVYIVDEVHMLTDAAFNALLKTLEEPPGHAIFILATTEVHKVPLTIVSRCQRYDFRRIPIDAIHQKLLQLSNAEGVEAEGDALDLLARHSTGSLRDAENLLEQAVVSYGSPLMGEQVRDMLELTGDEDALDLCEMVVGRKVAEGFSLISRIADQGSDLGQLQRALTEFLRAVMLISSGGRRLVPVFGHDRRAACEDRCGSRPQSGTTSAESVRRGRLKAGRVVATAVRASARGVQPGACGRARSTTTGRAASRKTRTSCRRPGSEIACTVRTAAPGATTTERSSPSCAGAERGRASSHQTGRAPGSRVA